MELNMSFFGRFLVFSIGILKYFLWENDTTLGWWSLATKKLKMAERLKIKCVGKDTTVLHSFLDLA